MNCIDFGYQNKAIVAQTVRDPLLGSDVQMIWIGRRSEAFQTHYCCPSIQRAICEGFEYMGSELGRHSSSYHNVIV